MRIRHPVVLLVVLAFVLLLPGLGARDLWNPNEPIYGLAVREMAERGDWVVPTVQGIDFAEKPILYFWLARLFGLAGGVDEATLRLSSVLAVLVLLGATWSLVRSRAGPDRALWTGLVLLTTYTVWWGGRTAQMDVLVAASMACTIAAAVRAVDRDSTGWWVLAGVAAGAGFLSKGPVAWVLPSIALVGWSVATGRVRRLFSVRALAGAAAAVAVAAPWYVVLAIQGRMEFLHEVLIRQNFSRFVDAWDHAQPWWYYLQAFWTEMAPWALVVPAAWALPDRSDEERDLDRLAWVWLVGTVVFFSLSESKRTTYILPAAPAVAILVSGVLTRLAAGRLSRPRRDLTLALLVAVAIVVGVLGVAAWVEVPGRFPSLAVQARVLGGILAGGAAAVVTAVFWRRRALVAVPAALVAVLAVLFSVAGGAVLPGVDVVKSARPFAEALVACAGDDGRVVSYDLWKWRAGYAYYAGRTFDNVRTPEELARWVAGPGRRFVLAEPAGRDEVEAVVGAGPVLTRRVGHKDVYLFAVPPATCAEPPTASR